MGVFYSKWLRCSGDALRSLGAALVAFVGVALTAGPVGASPLFFFSTGNVTNQVATASRPGPQAGPNQETETADDFALASATRITAASFTGLIPQGVSLTDIKNVDAEIYRAFPSQSDAGRTPRVPTRTNSPSDVAFATASSSGSLSYSIALLDNSFTVQNSVDTGINPFPNQTTGGEGPIVGQEVQFDITFSSPFNLAAGHYFFVPQVELNDPDQHFLWLSASKPIDASGTPLSSDLQSWIRNASLDPDWLRVGTDVLGSGSYNAAFTLTGAITTVPLPGGLELFGMAVIAFGFLGYASDRSGHRQRSW